MKKQISDKQILDSGTLVIANNDTITFLFDEANPSITVNIKFQNDTLEKQARFKTEQTTATSLELNLINANSQLGTGSSEPFHLVNLNGYKIFLRFICYSLATPSGNDVKTFHYTWFQGDKL